MSVMEVYSRNRCVQIMAKSILTGLEKERNTCILRFFQEL